MEKTILETGSSVKTTLKLPGKKDFFTQEAFKTLRTNLQFCGQDICTVVITSCNENEGKTTITLQLAKSLAELNKRVLVIDADMRKSVMAGRNTTAENPAGLSEVLTGLTSVKECLYQTQYDNLSIMFAGKYPPNPVELLSGQYFEELLKAAKESYDYVLIDVPPLGSVIDCRRSSQMRWNNPCHFGQSSPLPAGHRGHRTTEEKWKQDSRSSSQQH